MVSGRMRPMDIMGRIAILGAGLFVLAGCASAPALPSVSSALCQPGPMFECKVRVSQIVEAGRKSFEDGHAEMSKDQRMAGGAIFSAGGEYERWGKECIPVQGDSNMACRQLAESMGNHVLTIDPTLAW